MEDPTNVSVLDDIKFMTGYNVEPVVAHRAAIEKAIASHYRDTALHNEVRLLESAAPRELERFDDEAPIVKLCDLILTDAVRRGASEIHIEPYENEFRVRFRIGGVLYTAIHPALKLREPIAIRFKVMSKMDISEKRLPQWGRIRIRMSKDGKLRKHDLELHTVPTRWGEKLFLRVHNLTPKGLAELGFEQEPLAMLEEILKDSSGLVLVCGPMRSGKTQTLYAAIHSLNTPRQHIVTVEDTVELDLPGVTQIEVRWARGCDMASALRTVLAQYPDIVMAGNLASPEAAAVVVEAARRHFMIGGLTAQDAAAAINYLLNPPRGPEDSHGGYRATRPIRSAETYGWS